MTDLKISNPTLEQRMQAAGGPVQMLRGPGQLGTYVFPGIPPEFTNWRDEQRAWKEGVALLEMTHHMVELHLRGRGVLDFLGEYTLNRYDPFPVDKGKQIVAVSPDGYIVGDAIAFHEEDGFVRVIGAPQVPDWLLFQTLTSDHDVTAELKALPAVTGVPHDRFRLQIQGPHALDLVRKVTDGTLPQIGFFSIGAFSVAGNPVRALRHGMAGAPGFEIFGLRDGEEAVRAAFDEAGLEYGLRKIGAFAYHTAQNESGWMPQPLPAIYHADQLRSYREWTSAQSFEALGSLGGSLVRDCIEDYYVDPIELGYGRLVDWNRPFLGRDALQERARSQRRTKVTLVWDDDDVTATNHAALFDSEHPAQLISLPNPVYATWPADAVLSGGETVGFSHVSSFSANAGHILSHGIVPLDVAKPGTELTLLWGEPDSRRDNVGRNELRQIRVTVAPTPYFAKEIQSANH